MANINLGTAFSVPTTAECAGKIAPVGRMYEDLAKSVIETGGGWNADTTLAVRELQTSYFRFTQAVLHGGAVAGGN